MNYTNTYIGPITEADANQYREMKIAAIERLISGTPFNLDSLSELISRICPVMRSVSIHSHVRAPYIYSGIITQGFVVSYDNPELGKLELGVHLKRKTAEERYTIKVSRLYEDINGDASKNYTEAEQVDGEMLGMIVSMLLDFQNCWDDQFIDF